MWSESRTGATSTAAEAPSPHRPGPIGHGKKVCRIGPGQCGTSENSVLAKSAAFSFQDVPSGTLDEWSRMVQRHQGKGERYHLRSNLGNGSLIPFACHHRQLGGLRLARCARGLV